MKLYAKIDLFFNGDYVCSTEQARTLREARARYLEAIQRYANNRTLVQDRIYKRPDLLRCKFDRGS